MTFAFHQVGFVAHGYELVGAVVEGHNRRLVYYNLVVMDYYRVGCAKVDSDFFCKRKQLHFLWVVEKSELVFEVAETGHDHGHAVLWQYSTESVSRIEPPGWIT